MSFEDMVDLLVASLPILMELTAGQPLDVAATTIDDVAVLIAEHVER